MFTDKKYMRFSDVKLKTPLLSVKRAENGKDILVVPYGIAAEMKPFFDRDKIEYQIIENTALCSPDEIRVGMQRYMDISSGYDIDDAVLLITNFDKDALFQWSKLVFGKTIDPAYRAVLKSEQKRGEDYDNHLYEYRP